MRWHFSHSSPPASFSLSYGCDQECVCLRDVLLGYLPLSVWILSVAGMSVIGKAPLSPIPYIFLSFPPFSPYAVQGDHKVLDFPYPSLPDLLTVAGEGKAIESFPAIMKCNPLLCHYIRWVMVSGVWLLVMFLYITTAVQPANRTGMTSDSGSTSRR